MPLFDGMGDIVAGQGVIITSSAGAMTLLGHSGALADRARDVLAPTANAVWLHNSVQMAVKTVLMRCAALGRSVVVVASPVLGCVDVVRKVTEVLRQPAPGTDHSPVVATTAGSVGGGGAGAGVNGGAGSGHAPVSMSHVTRLDSCAPYADGGMCRSEVLMTLGVLVA